MIAALEDLHPAPLWEHFAALAAIPRPPGQEQRAMEYVKKLADERFLPWREDAFGNVVVYVEGSPGPVVAVQAHLDMVCEKNPDVDHNFWTDPINVDRDGDVVFAQGTTLGADNGIGAAACLALMTVSGIEHPALELVFTVQEETGLHGAIAFDPDLMDAEMLINLDSEDPDELIVGCAGGVTIDIGLQVAREDPPEGWEACELSVSGLRGGHSGIEIHRKRANALKLLVGSLREAQAVGHDLRVCSISGGGAHNVIPRDAAARLLVPAAGFAGLQGAVEGTARMLTSGWADAEPALHLALEQKGEPAPALDDGSAGTLLDLLDELPHGIIKMSSKFPDKVETSANLAHVSTGDDEVHILTSVRSPVDKQLQAVRTSIENLAKRMGAHPEPQDGYPGWDPDPDAELLAVAKRKYEEVYGKPASVQVIHAGLECGALVAKRPGMQAISFGPHITGAHSPKEQVRAWTVEATWKLLVGILAELIS
ncbi:MAG: beta-Ala-His dipeptidase [Actinobacteria bacterium]|nr:beta-Ala-His dipeptidase [Actinomycetota bacterium]